jgi:lipopolysaccharide heptosyltransferase II
MPEISRLVIRAPNWLGDAVMALPAMGAVREAFPSAHLAVAAIPSIAPLFQEQTNARQDNVVVLRDRRDEDTVLADGKYEAIVLLPNSFRSAWTAKRASIAERWGYSANVRRWLLTKAVPRPRGHRHQSMYYLDLVRGLGLAASETLPRIMVTPATAARATALLTDAGVASGDRVIGFAPGAAYGHAKRWAPSRVAEVIVRLSREHGARCLLFGAAGDREAGREIESTLPPDVRAIDLIGRTDLRQLSGAIAQCAAFVSNDSGSMHLAAALGVPVTAIFGPTDERATAPTGWEPGSTEPSKHASHDVLIHPVFCRPCMLRECPIDHRCMKRITSEQVVESVSRRLEVVS